MQVQTLRVDNPHASFNVVITNMQDDETGKYLNKRDYGRVPAYLLERKMELAEHAEAVVRAKEAALIPPGSRVLLASGLEHRVIACC